MEMSTTEKQEYVVQKILQKKVERKKTFYLVHWEGYNKPEDLTWEPLESFVGSENLIEEFEKSHKTARKNASKVSVKKGVTLKARKPKKRSIAELSDQVPATQEPPAKVTRGHEVEAPAIDSFLGDPTTWSKSQYRVETEVVKRVLDISKVENGLFVICAFSDELELTIADIEPTPYELIRELEPTIMLDYLATYLL
ncbi:Chromo' (CHRromatin Organization MOdifier) domain protein [Aphelenchoides besseyi]|nr:Chromo' (CHRromatin Organization MOdifier) domain protein [Aphelenchoides besseyi]